MNHRLILLSLLLLTNIGHSFEPAAQEGPKQTATVQIFPSLALPYSERFIGNQMALLTTGPILGPAAKACGLASESIAASLKLQRIKDSELLTVSSLHDDKEQRQVIVKAVLDSYLDHRKRLDAIAGGLGETHPKIKALDTKASKALKNAIKETVSLRAVLKTHLELVSRQVERMTEMVKAREADADDLSQGQQEYNLAKAAYDNSREQLRSLKLQQEELRATLKDTRHIIIHGWGNQ